uniref:Uncharacterized protein n=1 Tax=viral metagenome TaxID=1070528 RepID=A0A6M3KUJ7_9ZZZZ
MSESQIRKSPYGMWWKWVVVTGHMETCFTGEQGAAEQIATLHQEIERLTADNKKLNREVTEVTKECVAARKRQNELILENRKLRKARRRFLTRVYPTIAPSERR